MANTTKYVIPKLDPTALVKNGPTDVNAALDAIDSKMTGYSEGPLASRPVSTGGSPGIKGRIYRATDTTQVFFDTGTGWDDLFRRGELPTIMGQYRTVAQGSAFLNAQVATLAATWYATSLGGAAARSGTDGVAMFVGITPSDYSVSGLTTQFRLSVVTAVNATAPATNLAYALAPVSSLAGGANIFTVTVGSAAGTATVTRSTPSAGTSYQDATADFTINSAGVYVFSITNSAAMATNSIIAATMRLQVRHV